MDITKPTLSGIPGGITSSTIKTHAVNRARETRKEKETKFKTSSQEKASPQVSNSSQAFCVTALDSFLFQESSQKEQKKQQIQRGQDLLDQLDQLHQDLLVGKVTHQELLMLSQSLKNKTGSIQDPHLAEIIREIEIRVTVELTKLGVTL